MAFVTFEFLIFICITIGVYFVVPKSYRWIVLLVSSYYYYYSVSNWLTLIMFSTTLITFITGLGIGRIYKRRDAEIELSLDDETFDQGKCTLQAKKKAKGVMLLGTLTVLLILVFMKYYGFLNDIVKSVIGIGGPKLNLLLPLGISFYTLQAMAYILDVYRSKTKVDTNFPKFMLFMSFFPQIVQGPIARHKQLAEQLYEGHDFDYGRVSKGAQLILWGFMKKLIVADRLISPVNAIFDNFEDYYGMILFFAAALYGLQVYADFSGGMDIARGVSQIMGIELELNFKQPYFAVSVEDFWRRWHITLGAWMRDYVFYPLSLSKLFVNIGKKARKIFGNDIGKKIPPFIAMFIVYFLVGIWHGSSWKYIFYGVYNGVFIVMGILLGDVYDKIKDRLKISSNDSAWKVFQMIRTFMIISIGRMFSRAFRLQHGFKMFKSMFYRWYSPFFIVDGTLLKLGLNTANWIVLALGVLCIILVDVVHEKDISIRDWLEGQHLIVRWGILYLAVIIVLIFGIYGPVFDNATFIYEQF